MNKKVVIIGGGAAGVMAAISAAESECSVTVIEKMPRPLRKVMITGKGRCNVTNNTTVEKLIASVTKNGKFLYSAFNTFDSADTMSFFESAGVALKTERGNRVFPVSDKSVDIVDALVNTAKKRGVRFVTDTVGTIMTEDGEAVGVECESGNKYYADSVILATGGKSYPLTGSTGDGYRLAEEIGHTVTELSPSLVPIVTRDEWCSALQGLALKNISVKVFQGDSKKPVYEDFGELMLTHYGLSGPTILSASAHMRKNNGEGYRIEIDLKPALDEATLDKRILRDLSENNNKDIINSLDALLPKRLIPIVVAKAGIPANTKSHSVTKEQRASLVSVLKHLTATSFGFRPIEEAIVTSGGIKVGEINPSTMESKLVKGLYFAGEIIDVDAYTGGFNLQIAFSTGYLAGKNA